MITATTTSFRDVVRIMELKTEYEEANSSIQQDIPEALHKMTPDTASWILTYYSHKQGEDWERVRDICRDFLKLS